MIETLYNELNKAFDNIQIKIVNDKIEISDFNIKGLRITIDYRVVIRLYEVEHINPKYLQTYFDIHSNDEFVRKISNTSGIYFYHNEAFNDKKYSKSSIREFEKRMWVIRMLRDLECVILKAKF